MPMQMAGSYNDVCYNVSDTTRVIPYRGMEQFGLTLSTSDASYCAYNRFSNNVFLHCDGPAIGVTIHAYVHDNEILNNIAIDCGVNAGSKLYPPNQMSYTDLNLTGIEGGTVPTQSNIFRNNNLYNSATANTIVWLQYPHDDDKIPVGSWNGDSRGGNTISGNLATDPHLNANFSLSASSTEMINGGYAWNTGLGAQGAPGTDYWGNAVTNTTGVIDIGAIEYGGQQGGQDTLAVVTTSAATNVSTYTATLNGTIDAQSTTTTPRFVWGTSAGTYTDSTAGSPDPVTGTTTTNETANIGGLSASTQYYFRLRGYNAKGAAQGSELNFTTSAGDVTRPINYAHATAGPLTDQASINATLSASSNADRMIIAFVIGYHANGFPVVSSITCGGNAMTSIGSQMNPWNVMGVRAYYCLAPATGNNQVSVTMASAPTNLSLIVSSWYQVNQSTPLGTALSSQGVGNQMSLTFTTQDGDVVVDCGISNYNSPFTGLSSGQTEICRIDGAGFINDPMHTQKPNTGTSTLMTQDVGSEGYAYFGFPIHKNSAAPPPPSTSKRVIILLHR
jgi:hypothetical protein